MGLTRFPRGVSSFGIPQLGNDGLIPSTSGSYFWVDSNSTATGSVTGDYDAPYTTLMAAYAACTASANDVIIIKPGHTETVLTNTLMTFNKIGVSVVGLGNGSLRPAFTLTGTTTAATFAVSAANQLFRNFTITSGRDEMVSVWTITADYCDIDGVDYLDNAAASIASYVTTTTAGNRLTVRNCSITNSVTATLEGAAITLVGSDDSLIQNNYIWWVNGNSAADGCIASITTASLRLRILGNELYAGGGNAVTVINTMAGTTGVCSNNMCQSTKTAAAGSLVLTAMYGNQNYTTVVVNNSGILTPAVT